MNYRLIVCFRLQWKNTIHQNRLNFLLTKVYKYLSRYSPNLMNEVFYLRSFNVFAIDNPRNKYLSNSSIYRANQLWQTPPSEIKVGLSPSKKSFFICFNDRPSKMIKNAFYFILKALFVLKIFKLLSLVFGQVEKTAWLERLG